MKGAGKGVTRDRAIRNGASEEITSGTHMMAVYLALFNLRNVLAASCYKIT